MHAVRFHEHGGRNVLQVDDIDTPEPVSDEVLVEVAAAGVNPVDTYFREGSYQPFAMPMIPGIDVAGTVAAVGPGVTEFEAGDSVVGTGIGKDHYGGYAEFAAVPTDRLAVLPEDVDLVAAGGAGVVGVTAWRALVDHGGMQLGETVLIHGGSGGVGHTAVQLADAAGAHVIATAAPKNHDRVSELGADVVLDYSRDDLADAVKDAANGDGVDLTLDHRLDDYLQFDAEVATTGGRVVGIGENDPQVGFELSSAARGKDLNITMMSMFNTPELAVPLRELAGLMETGDFEIEVARTYDLDEAAEAHRAVMEDSFLGKLVITP
ncbi:NADPH:quinone reductase [Haloferax mediterranei ATCC 33500]|uniref:NADPH:quinone reductase n=1 Tax=Haloferax mediterranei (strain ATCC 33500 / DSM 1411 / JCM 8866 / NBRC 14739 / NCIMB 2177 / R-4) TaxID=523841 RepID=I3R7E7_HALMT|nr:NADPH:quinone reductase [Haloferax mediterranei]AFK20157.2 Zn-dependent oxidoreductase, NADPH:quinone reductase / NADPH2:quinone reductase [Haloferax mediterranei ATCC 33500]AHZ23531.1 zinc-binding dehydrogenase [Haloferax mediterranei ATCC 33500]ELZ99706.1 Zn-dependent oxidoreductase, NADPH:quinone reductase / NADPH2:quinone reductase [Haloferax mediterranei ATCC 33500]MDX5987090.1 NADPH:quinone reductase [Haloferax mediterranei ATCC 33500]QCQ76405.1 NADPH:quinone reductase [Haloferax medi